MKAELLRAIAQDDELLGIAQKAVEAVHSKPTEITIAGQLVARVKPKEVIAIGLRAIADKLEHDEPWWNAKQDPSRRQLGQG